MEFIQLGAGLQASAHVPVKIAKRRKTIYERIRILNKRGR